MANESATLLVVDDDDVDIMAIERTMESLEMRNPMVVANNGLEALDHLRGTNGKSRLERPYAIVLDLNMPKMNGFEFLEEIRSDPDIKDSVVFVLTTSDDNRDRDRAFDFDVSGYLVKSGPGGNLLQSVRMLGDLLANASLP